MIKIIFLVGFMWCSSIFSMIESSQEDYSQRDTEIVEFINWRSAFMIMHDQDNLLQEERGYWQISLKDWSENWFITWPTLKWPQWVVSYDSFERNEDRLLVQSLRQKLRRVKDICETMEENRLRGVKGEKRSYLKNVVEQLDSLYKSCDEATPVSHFIKVRTEYFLSALKKYISS